MISRKTTFILNRNCTYQQRVYPDMRKNLQLPLQTHRLNYSWPGSAARVNPSSHAAGDLRALRVGVAQGRTDQQRRIRSFISCNRDAASAWTGGVSVRRPVGSREGAIGGSFGEFLGGPKKEARRRRGGRSMLYGNTYVLGGSCASFHFE
jgi:hypothetical protein